MVFYYEIVILSASMILLLLLLHAATGKVLHHSFPVPVRRDILRSHNERRIR